MGNAPMGPESSSSVERCAITLALILAGTLLIWKYGDASPLVAGVSSVWILVLSFWFPSRGGNGRS